MRYLVLFAFLTFPHVGMSQPLSFGIDTGNCAIERRMADHARNRLDNDLQRDFHDVLMVNELSGGCGSLQFTDAKMASNTNGFSFGLSQFDLATRPKASLDTLNKIIACSREEKVSPVLSKSDYEFLQNNAMSSTFLLKQDAQKWSRFHAMRPALEAALRSKCGQQYIENSYIAEIRGLESQMMTWWSVIERQNPAMMPASKFFQLYELDLLNVFGGTEGFRKVVSGSNEPACGRLCAAKVVPVFKLDGPVSVSDLIRYVQTTNCYGYIPQQTRQQDALRRLNTVLSKIDLASLPLDESDRQYLVREFADTIARNKARFPNSPDQKLRELVAVANGGTPVNGNDTPVNETLMQAAIRVCSKT